MKISSLSIVFLMLSAAVFAQADMNDKYASHVKTLDSTIETLYAVISGEKGEKRDWDLFNYLFIPEARLMPTRKTEDGGTGYFCWSPQEYVDQAGEYLETNGFFEKEISRKTDRYGNIVQLFSTYESYRSESDDAPFARGINSIQLMYDGNRWWVMSIFWEGETPANPIPDKYLD